MDIKNNTSQSSYWRGFHYYRNGNVLSFEKVNDHVYKGKVKGSGKNIYDVTLDINDIASSDCNCATAFGNKRKICKHKVALYFAIFPEEAETAQLMFEDFTDEMKKRQDEFEEFYAKKAERINTMLDTLSPYQQRNMLYGMLMADTMDEFYKSNGYRAEDIDEEVISDLHSEDNKNS